VAVADAIGELGDETTAQALLPDLQHADPLVRSSVTLALGRLRHKPNFETMLAMLGDDHHWVRYAAAVALGELEDVRAVDALIPLLAGDVDYLVRAGAARSLGRIRHPKAIRPLRRAVVKDDNELVRADALEALRLIWNGSPGEEE
jgi:HEAT repeat protein